MRINKIKMGLREKDCEDVISMDLIQDYVQWWAWCSGVQPLSSTALQLA